MPPLRSRKRKSPSPGDSPQQSPIKKLKTGITLAQKQALVDNLQLEITERARRLRAQYNIQAQQLRSRVEMRVNRIPTTLRKLSMSELFARSQQPQNPPTLPRSAYISKPPPVPAKDGTSPKPIPRKPVPATTTTNTSTGNWVGTSAGTSSSTSTRGQKRSSDQMSGADKENRGDAIENPKKRVRAAPTNARATAAQVLSPTSSNTRYVPRDRPASPAKSMISRPPSPIKAPVAKASSSNLSSTTEKATTARSRPTTVRKTTTSSTASSHNGTTATTATGRGRRAAAAPPPSTATTRATKAAPKQTVMSTIKSATTRKPPAARAAAAPSQRTLRKRG